MLRSIFRVCVLLVLSSLMMVAGCTDYGRPVGTTSVIPSLIIPSTTASGTTNSAPLPPDYGGEVILAREGEGPTDIWLDNYECIPNVLTVVRGTTVTWTSFEFKPLGIISEDGSFSGNIEPKLTWNYNFATTGTFGYSIDPYSGVWRGVVIVIE